MQTPLKSLGIGSLTLTAYPYSVAEYDLPDAELTDFGRAAQLSGAPRYASHYSDAIWQLTINVHDATTARIDALIEAVCAGAVMTAGGEVGTFSSTVRSARTVGIDNTEAVASVMLSGTRTPAWRGATTAFSTDSSPYTLPTVGGTLAAELNLSIISDAQSGTIASGIMHDPQTGFDWSDASDGSGGGGFGANVNLSTTPATVWAGADIDVAANRGTYHVCAYLKHSASASSSVLYTAGSTILTASAPARPVAATAAATVEYLGKVSIPAAALPEREGGKSYKTETVGWAGTGTYASHATSTRDAPESQTFKAVKTGKLNAISVQTAATGAGNCPLIYVYRGATLIAMSLPIYAAADTWVRFDLITPPSVTAGETLKFYVSAANGESIVELHHASSTQYVDGARTAGGDLAFKTYEAEELNFNAKTPITAVCSESSKTAAFGSLWRIPADFGAFVYKGASAANAGVLYDSVTDAFYPCDATGATGTALAPVRSGEMQLPPGNNALCTLVSGGGTISITGTFTEQRLSRG